MPSFSLASLALASTLLVAAPSRHEQAPPELAFDCYLTQSGSLGLGQFVRHLQVRPARALVVIADGLGGAAPRFVGNARLVALDADRLVYDFAAQNSAGRTEIDRRTGTFRYDDGRSVIRGTCQQTGL